MEKQLSIDFFTTYSGWQPQEIPSQKNREYEGQLEANPPKLHVVRADVLGCGRAEVAAITKQFKETEVDVIVMVYGAFTGDDISTCLSKMLKVPIILQAPYEVPSQKDDRLCSSTLCATTTSSTAFHRVGVKCHIVYGSWGDKRAARKVKSLLMAYYTVKCLKHTQLGLLGYRPTIFYSCVFDESLTHRVFGVKIEKTDLKVVFNKMDALLEEVYETDMAKMEQEFGTSRVLEGHSENRFKLYLTLKGVMAEQNYDFGTLKCWPGMGNLHATPCAVSGRLVDEGINIGCEGNVDAELTQMAKLYLTGQPSFITDMTNIDEKESVMTFWRCGNAAPSLCNSKHPVSMYDRPLVEQGAASYRALKLDKVTVARFCNLGGEYRLFPLRREAMDIDRCTEDIVTSVRVEKPMREVIEQIIKEGVPRHHSLVWMDATDELKEVRGLLRTQVIEVQDLRAVWQG